MKCGGCGRLAPSEVEHELHATHGWLSILWGKAMRFEACSRHCLAKFSTDPAERIVDEIVKDISDRHGLKHEWREVAPEVRAEIVEVWRAIVRRHVDAARDGVDE